MEGCKGRPQPIVRALKLHTSLNGLSALRRECPSSGASEPWLLRGKRLCIVGKERDRLPWLIGQPNRRTKGQFSLTCMGRIRRVIGRAIREILFEVIEPTASVQVEIVQEAHVIPKVESQDVIDRLAIAEFRERRIEEKPVPSVEDIDETNIGYIEPFAYSINNPRLIARCERVKTSNIIRFTFSDKFC